MIGSFLKRHMAAEDVWLAACMLLMLSTAALLFVVNAASFHFTGISYFPRQEIALLFPVIELAAFGLYSRDSSPRAAFIARNGACYALTAMSVSVLVTAVQFTPFATIDARLSAWDQALRVDLPALMRWTYARPVWRAVLQAAYPALNLEVIAVPCAALFFHDRRRTRVYIYAIAYSAFLADLFYYFFPSSGPASLLRSPYFSTEQHLTALKFYQVHHFEPVETLLGGMIAFPSMHVVWACLVTYAALPRKLFFYPIAALNVLVILSTVLLGWHFLVDALAGMALAAVSLGLAELSHARLGTVVVGKSSIKIGISS